MGPVQPGQNVQSFLDGTATSHRSQPTRPARLQPLWVIVAPCRFRATSERLPRGRLHLPVQRVWRSANPQKPAGLPRTLAFGHERKPLAYRCNREVRFLRRDGASRSSTAGSAETDRPLRLSLHELFGVHDYRATAPGANPACGRTVCIVLQRFRNPPHPRSFAK